MVAALFAADSYSVDDCRRVEDREIFRDDSEGSICPRFEIAGVEIRPIVQFFCGGKDSGLRFLSDTRLIVEYLGYCRYRISCIFGDSYTESLNKESCKCRYTERIFSG